MHISAAQSTRVAMHELDLAAAAAAAAREDRFVRDDGRDAQEEGDGRKTRISRAPSATSQIDTSATSEPWANLVFMMVAEAASG